MSVDVMPQRSKVSETADPSAGRLLLLGVPMVLAIAGFQAGASSFGRANVIDVVCVIGALVVGRRVVTRRLGLGAALLGYAGAKFVYMYLTDGLLIGDFIQAYKAWILLGFAAIAVGRRAFSAVQIAWWARAMIVVYLVGYLLQVATNPAVRPNLITENNFELCLVIGLFVIAHRALGSVRGLWFAALAAVVILSQSRSGIAELGLAYLVCFVSPRRVSFVFQVAAAYGFYVVAGRVFAERSQESSGPLDRVKFFDYFKTEVSDWSIVHWLFGNAPLTPLRPSTCEGLSFYKDLFSKADPSVCYPVILHSGLMRLVLENGVLGASVLLLAIVVVMRRAGVPRAVWIGLLGIGVLNSFSVSGFNSSLCVLPVLVAVLVDWPARHADLPEDEDAESSPQLSLEGPSSHRARRSTDD